MKKSLSRNLYSLLSGVIILPLVLCTCGLRSMASSVSAEPSTEENAIPNLIISKCYLPAGADSQTSADGYYQTFLLTDDSAERFPALSTGLAEINSSISEQTALSFQELIEETSRYSAGASADGDNQNPTGTLESVIHPVRQDSSIVSFFISCRSFITGTSYSKTGIRGCTLDSYTGRQVAFEDIIKDFDGLVNAASENLVFMSTGESAGDRWETLKVNFSSVDYFPTWTLSNNGILFRFAPGEIGNYEEGWIQSEVSFSRYPELFTDKYSPNTGAYTMPISTDEPLSMDINGDGVSEKISLGATPYKDEDCFAYNEITVSIGDKICRYECWFYTIRGILIHENNNRNYLYVQVLTDNDYPVISIFDLNTETPVYVTDLNGTCLSTRYREDSTVKDLWCLDEQLLTDPLCFSLDSRFDLMSTYSASASYRLGSDGTPEHLRDYYEIECDYELTSLRPLTCAVIDPINNIVIQAGVTIPEGTTLKFFRTNGIDLVDMTSSDGTVYRFTVVSDRWPQTVNGVNLDEAFDGFMFAS